MQTVVVVIGTVVGATYTVVTGARVVGVVGVVGATGVVVGALAGGIVVVTAPPEGTFPFGVVECCAKVVVAWALGLLFECDSPELGGNVVVECPIDVGVVPTGECTERAGTLVEDSVLVAVDDARFAALAK